MNLTIRTAAILLGILFIVAANIAVYRAVAPFAVSSDDNDILRKPTLINIYSTKEVNYFINSAFSQILPQILFSALLAIAGVCIVAWAFDSSFFSNIFLLFSDLISKDRIKRFFGISTAEPSNSNTAKRNIKQTRNTSLSVCPVCGKSDKLIYEGVVDKKSKTITKLTFYCKRCKREV